MSLEFDPKDIVTITQTAKQTMGALSTLKAISAAAKNIKSLGGILALNALIGFAKIKHSRGTSGNLGITEVTITPRGFAGLSFDALFEECHTSEMEATDNPIETGVSTTDHAYVKPARLKITAGVTNTPLVDRAPMYGVGAERAQNAWKALRRLQATREPFDVQTGLDLYRNMVCTSLSTTQDKESANALIFTAELKEIIIVSTQTVTYPTRKGKALNQAGKKRESGQKQGEEVTEKTKKASIAKTLAGAIGKFL